MINDDAPAPMEKSKPYPGQECYLFTYVLAKEPVDGVIGFFKFISAHSDPGSARNDWKRVANTNKQCQMKWGIGGEWEVIRTPETDTEGTIDIVKLGDEEEEFMGEKIPIRDVLKENDKNEEIRDRVAIDTYKSNIAARKLEEKRLALKRKAMEEIQKELDDPTSLASYAQLHWKRLTQKSAIAEVRDKLEEAQQALMKTIKEIAARKRIYPQYENQWQNEIRRIQKISNPKQADVNPVDKPISELGDYDDKELAQLKIADVEDEFDKGIGVEAKGKDKEEQDEEKEEGAIDKRVEELKAEVEKRNAEIAQSFLPDAPMKKLGPQRKVKKKPNKKKK